MSMPELKVCPHPLRLCRSVSFNERGLNLIQQGRRHSGLSEGRRFWVVRSMKGNTKMRYKMDEKRNTLYVRWICCFIDRISDGIGIDWNSYKSTRSCDLIFGLVFLYSFQFFKRLHGPVILNAAGKRKDIKRSVLFSCTGHIMSLKHQLYISSFTFWSII